MTTEQAMGAAHFLVSARQSGGSATRMPEELRPQDIEDALRVQGLVGELLGEATAGWKCGLPSAGKVGVAPIFASAIYRRSNIPIKGPVARVEQEIAYVMGRDLPPRAEPYSAAEVCEAVQQTRLVLELIGSRFLESAEPDFLEKLADSLSNEGLFVGSGIGLEPDDSVLATFPIVVDSRAGIVMERDGKHPDGHPFLPLHWLANFLAGRGTGLKAGQIVTTGSYAGALELPVNTPLRIMFGGLGDVDCELIR